MRDYVSLSALSRCSRSALSVANTVDVFVPASPVRRRCSSKLPKREDHVLGFLRPTRHVLMKTGLSQQERATTTTVTRHLLVVPCVREEGMLTLRFRYATSTMPELILRVVGQGSFQPFFSWGGFSSPGFLVFSKVPLCFLRAFQPCLG